MIPKFIEVQSDDFKEVVVYETIDGKTFDSEIQALHHEDRIKIGKIKKIYRDFEIGDIWYNPSDDEQVDILKRRFSFSGDISEDNLNKIKTNQWINVHCNYGGDYPDEYTITTFDEFKKEIDALFALLSQ